MEILTKYLTKKQSSCTKKRQLVGTFVLLMEAKYSFPHKN